ncbi:hypothetical protein [Dysgonomonas macrotermitis]|uniref:Uncharacterized protein n=1 Tax=Dysgonomonas macrotermitis TaxID=1346286 RepID=A0A1M5HBZ6_9BACT|nr:hypothetical protein [Dysgonomonas macrotermitis]SHG13431.1 hypothetical protein SAMN05444362_11616 [Dysgonomonas macrotermitis]
MDSTTLQQVLSAIAGDVLSITRQVFDENGLRDSSIREKVEVKLSAEPNPIIRILFDDYLDHIENGRKAGSGEMPSIDELRDWAIRKGIPTTNDVLFAIANAIRRDGIAARPILSILEQRLDTAFEDKWADDLFDAITEELTVFFDR